MITTLVTYTAKTCQSCGVPFALSDDFIRARRKDGATWYCPNGHPWVYRETDADRLKAELKRTKQSLEWSRTAAQAARDQAAASERSARAYKGVATRVKRRAAHGVCPCCTRTFADVARHMAGQHPEFVSAHGSTTGGDQ